VQAADGEAVPAQRHDHVRAQAAAPERRPQRQSKMSPPVVQVDRHNSASPASSPLASSTAENTAWSSRGSLTAYGDAAEPADTGRHGRESACTRVAMSSYSSACSTATSASSRARSPILPARRTRDGRDDRDISQLADACQAGAAAR